MWFVSDSSVGGKHVLCEPYACPMWFAYDFYVMRIRSLCGSYAVPVVRMRSYQPVCSRMRSFLCGSCVISIWFACGSHVMFMWCICGPYVMCMRILPYLDVISKSCKFDLYAVPMSWVSGSYFRCMTCLCVVMWCVCNAHVIRMWCPCGSCVIRMWCICGPHVMCMWFLCDSNESHMCCVCGSYVNCASFLCALYVVPMWFLCDVYALPREGKFLDPVCDSSSS